MAIQDRELNLEKIEKRVREYEVIIEISRSKGNVKLHIENNHPHVGERGEPKERGKEATCS